MPRAAPQGSYVLKGARVVTMKGDEVLETADVFVTGNRIAAVGPSGSVPVPAGTRTFDGAGKTVIPGLIDTHAHLHYSAFELFPEAKWEYYANLAYGVTTTYDPSAPSLDVFAQGEQVEAGVMVGPRIYSSGDVLYGGQKAAIFAEVNSLEDAKHQVRRMKAYGARMIKVYQQPRRSQRIYFAEACRDEHMLLTAEGGGELQTDMTMVLDGFTAWEHALPVRLGSDIVDFVAKSQTFYTPTLLVAYGGPWGEEYYWQTANAHDDAKLNRFVPHDVIDQKARRMPWIWPSEYHFPTVAEGAAAVLRAGGNVSLGAHGQVQGLGPHWEIWAMAGEGNAREGRGDDADGSAARLDAPRRRQARLPAGSRLDRGRQARRLRRSRRQPARRHPQHRQDPVGRQERRGLGGETMKKLWPREEAPPKFFWKSGS